MKKKKIDDVECYKVFGGSFKTDMDLNDEIGSSGRNQQGPEKALLKKTFAARKKNVVVFQSINQENKRQLIIRTKICLFV